MCIRDSYTIESITSKINNVGFSITQSQKIGHNVYTPLAQYYFANRKKLRERIRTKYSSTTEKILYKSLEKMSRASENNLIDYLVLKCA